MLALLRPINRFVFLPLLAITITACGRPPIRIDDSELRSLEGVESATPVGLLEIRRANSGDSFGLSVGESLGESAYCTATMVSNTTIVTSSDCLLNKSGYFDAERMEFHIKRAGVKDTELFRIKKIGAVDSKQLLAFLTIENKSGIAVGTFFQFQSEPISDEALALNLSTLTLSVPAPDRNGISKIKVLSTKIETAITPSRTSASSDSSGQVRNPSLGEIFALPRPVVIHGVGSAILGAPVFYRGRVVAFTRRPGSKENTRANGQWVFKP